MTIRRLQRYATDTKGLIHACCKSSALGGRGTVSLWLPEQQTQDMPIMILLHGVYGCHLDWTASGRVHDIVTDLIDVGDIPPCALLMPSDGLSGDGSGYLSRQEADYERWIVEDCLDAAYWLSDMLSDQSPVAIGGLSMGGYGALRLGCKYPDRFTAITGHSSITRFDELFLFVEESRAQFTQWGPVQEDVIDYARMHAERLPPLHFDCGVDDRLLAGNRLLHKQLEDISVTHQYLEHAGGHSWDYWQTYVSDALRHAAATW